jgi:hypothetical protein
MINENTPGDRNVGRGISGVLKVFDKRVSASDRPTGFSLIKRTYVSAIEYTGKAPGTGGMMMFLGLLGGGLCISGVLWALLPDSGQPKAAADTIIDLVFGVPIFVFSLYYAILCFRMELFRPIDEPTIFDRENRKIYRLYSERVPGIRGLFVRWPIKTAEYDWDDMDAEHHASVIANSATISRAHALVFKVRPGREEKYPADSFTIGSTLQMSEQSVPAVWEHIRRFMEERGPHIPPGERTGEMKRDTSLSGCIRRTALYGRNFKSWWASSRALTILALIFAPVVYPTLALLGFFTWLGYKTAIRADLPAEVYNAIGRAAVPAEQAFRSE